MAGNICRELNLADWRVKGRAAILIPPTDFVYLVPSRPYGAENETRPFNRSSLSRQSHAAAPCPFSMVLARYFLPSLPKEVPSSTEKEVEEANTGVRKALKDAKGSRKTMVPSVQPPASYLLC
jgi:hypothetical protein